MPLAKRPQREPTEDWEQLRLFATRYPSPQPYLAPLAALPWQPAIRLPPYQARRPRSAGPGQAPLFSLGDDQRDEG